MKHFTKFIAVAIMALISINLWADTATMTWGTTGVGYNVFSTTSGTITNVLDFSTAKNDASTAPAYNSTKKQLRLYYNSKGNGGSITLTPKTGVIITEVKVYSATTPTLKYKIGSGSYTTAGTWSSSPYASNNTGLSVGSSSSITFINANTTNTQLQITQIDVTYTTSAGSKYTVVYANGGHGTAPSQQTEQTEITLTSLNADDGWNHMGWKADKDVKVDGVTKTAGTLLGKTDKCTLTANTTFTAQWECANTITILKGAETNGKFTLGTSGSVCIDGGNASTTVTCSPNAHYHVCEVTSTGGGEVSGSGNSWTVSNISASTTINVTFEEDTKYTVIFKNAGTQVSSKQVYANEAIGTLPEKGTMESCDDTSTTFMGWTTARISQKTSTEPTYVTAETVVDHDNFVVNAVWAKEETR